MNIASTALYLAAEAVPNLGKIRITILNPSVVSFSVFTDFDLSSRCGGTWQGPYYALWALVRGFGQVGCALNTPAQCSASHARLLRVSAHVAHVELHAGAVMHGARMRAVLSTVVLSA